jgi:Zn-dependent membrane protease YugP
MVNNPFFILLLPVFFLALFAQMRVKTIYNKYNEVHPARMLTAESVSRMLLDRLGLQRIQIERISGELTDHYDPRAQVLRFSDVVAGNSSIAAIGVAAHEVGHAIQDREGYLPLHLRNMFVPVANLGSAAAMPLFFLGLFTGAESLIGIGILFFFSVVLFHLITLPVELDASSKALRLLASSGTLNQDELAGAKSVLNAASLTYIAATLIAMLQLLRLWFFANGRRN